MKEVTLYGGTIDSCLKELRKMAAAEKSGEVLKADFNDKYLLSTDTDDDAYQRLLGMTKVEHEEKMRKWREEREAARKAFETRIPQLTERYRKAARGVIIESGKFDWAQSGKFPQFSEPNPSYHGAVFTQAAPGASFVTYIRAILLRDTGATLSPFHAFIFLQGLETLSLRVERHAENTKKVIEFLVNHPKVERVNHPSTDDSPYKALYEKYFPNGGGSIFTFDVKGGEEEAKKFIDNLQIFSLLANVADVKSLAIHPASTTHSQLNEAELEEQGIRPNTVRLSIGTEHIDDIIEDLAEAFDAI